MKITDLPQDIRERAEANAKNGRKPTHAYQDGSDTVSGAFAWNYTNEGWDFWSLVRYGEFDEARALLNGKNEGV